MPDLDPSDQEAAEEGGQELWVGAPEGAVGKVVVEGGGHGGGVGVLEGHEGKVQVTLFGGCRAPGERGVGGRGMGLGPP